MDDKGRRRSKLRSHERQRVGIKSYRQRIGTFLSTHKKSLFTAGLLTAMMVLLFGIFSQFQAPPTSPPPGGVTSIDYTTFVNQVQADNVLAVTMQNGAINALLAAPVSRDQTPTLAVGNGTSGKFAGDIATWNRYVAAGYTYWPSTATSTPIDPARTVYTRFPMDGDPGLLPLLVSKHVVVNTLPTSTAPFWLDLLWKLAPFVFFGLLLALMLTSRGNGRSMRSMDERISQLSKSRVRRFERAKEQPQSTPHSSPKPEKPMLARPASMRPAGQTLAPQVNVAPPVTFADVAGIDEVRVELEEIVQFLRSPERFNRLGARIPRGALLVGAPGTGKTLLAKAVAGEAGVPFFSISASEFVEMFVGVGASRVRDLFNQARKAAPCVIFIDEIDAVGRKRSVRVTNNDERDQTLNQLLVELDGFDERQAVVVLAATNRVDILDKALLRPGRFDRHINVSLPDRTGREAIMQVHTRKTPLHEEVDLGRLARMTTGMSGADLANLVNEAALGAARRDLDCLTHECFEEALSRVQLGALRPLVMSEHERRIIAFHEGGHALVARHLPEADTVNCVTILPRGQSLGVTQFIAEEDRYNYSRQFLMTRIAVGLGGRVAEELTFGAEHVTTGAENDLQVVTDLAHRMVTRWGMSEQVGVVYTDYRADMSGAGLNMRRSAIEPGSQARMLIADSAGHLHLNGDDGRIARAQYALAMSGPPTSSASSASMSALIDSEVQRILNEGRAIAHATLSEHHNQLTKLAEALIEHEHLNRAQFEALLQEEEQK
ncbi:MAG: ATP-dependent metallopeptidase FtsH/Yme1/Tma family protein [Ktedonobacteraceae bacterium]|nr:ATP-dependent metallopeptidase FtsH/Yme1/Tma family protein [Ktedonobacteraceae bacterium]